MLNYNCDNNDWAFGDDADKNQLSVGNFLSDILLKLRHSDHDCGHSLRISDICEADPSPSFTFYNINKLI